MMFIHVMNVIGSRPSLEAFFAAMEKRAFPRSFFRSRGKTRVPSQLFSQLWKNARSLAAFAHGCEKRYLMRGYVIGVWFPEV